MVELYLTHRIHLENSHRLDVVRGHGAYATAVLAGTTPVADATNRDAVIERARTRGFLHVINIGIDVATSIEGTSRVHRSTIASERIRRPSTKVS